MTATLLTLLADAVEAFHGQGLGLRFHAAEVLAVLGDDLAGAAPGAAP